MKKIIICCFALFTATTITAQTVNVHFKNGQKIRFNSENVDYVDFSEKAPDPTLTAGQVVDLGLSVSWSSCNLGAEKPEEYGDYYAWGETSPKSNFTPENYSYYDANSSQYINIGENISGTEYDAATVNLGSDWRMPTKEEMNELMDKCTWEWTQISNINGYKVTGINGNSIFIPAAGRRSYQTELGPNKELGYLTATQVNDANCYIFYQYQEIPGSYTIVGTNKWAVASIRLVTANNNEGGKYL